MRPCSPLLALIALVGCGNPHSPLIAPQPVHPEQIQRACAMEVSCLSSAPITPAGNCVSEFEIGLATGEGIFFGPSASDLSRYVTCANSSGDCTSALACASRNHGADWCSAHPNGGCDGDVLISCVAGWGLEQTDCDQLGMHCATSASGAASCTDGSSCDPQTAAAHCNGNRFVDCNGGTGLESAIDCAAVIAGGTCQETVGGIRSVGCRSSQSSSCGTNDSETCDGTTLVACSAGAVTRVDCTQLGSHCMATSSTTADCAPDGTDCTSQSPDTCVGDSLQLCVNGHWAQTACNSIGLGSCVTANGVSVCMP